MTELDHSFLKGEKVEETRELHGSGNCVARGIAWRGNCVAQGIAQLRELHGAGIVRRRELRGSRNCVAQELGIIGYICKIISQ